MTRQTKIVFIVLAFAALVAFFIAFLISKTEAAVLAGYTATSTGNVNDVIETGGPYFSAVEQGFSLAATSMVNKATAIIYDAGSCSATHFITARLLSGTTTPSNLESNTLASSTMTGAAICALPDYAPNQIFVPFNFATTSLSSGHTYYLSMDGATDINPWVWYYIGTTPKAQTETSYGYVGETESDLDDTHFYTIEGTAGTTTTISITYPEASTTSDFGSWSTFYDWGSATPDPAARVRVVAVKDLYNAFTDAGAVCGDAANCYLGIWKTHFLSAGLWSARAWLDNASGTPLASSSLVSFTIGPGPGAPTTTEYLASTTITCDPGSGFWSYSFCNVFSYLFAPSYAVLDKYANFTTTTQNGLTLYYKPPMGYFNSSKEVINTFSTSTTSTTPFPDLSLLYAGWLGTLRDSVGWVLWVLFLFWLFNRIRHLQL